MKRMAFLATACVLGTSACSTHVPTDAELVTLLHHEGATDASAALDASAVQCLRTWSGDAGLTRDLAPAVLADAAKARCRGTLDGWIADTKRNPAKFDFAAISAPEVTRRAMALLASREPAREVAHVATNAPAAATPALPEPVPQPAPEIEATLARASDLCEEAKSVTATDKSDVRLNRFVEYCQSAPAAATRTSVDRMKAANDAAGIDQIARRVANTNSVAEGLLRNRKH